MKSILQIISDDGTKRVSIYYDNPSDNPRSWSNYCHMICEHRRYDLGDSHNGIENELHLLCEKYGIDWEGDWENDVKEMTVAQMITELKKHIVIRPISIYDHSGVSIFWGGPCDRWDSGCVGFGYCELSDIERCGRNEKDFPDWHDQAKSIMDGEMETYDQYIRGEVYGFVLEERRAPSKQLVETPEWKEFIKDRWEDEFQWQEADSCWGFYDKPQELAENVLAGMY